MSGLAVLFHRDGRPVDRESIAAMLRVIPYRGADGLYTRIWDNVALGHARMDVTPEDHGVCQPLVSRHTGCAIIADVRLDNRADLLARLPGQPDNSISDAELLLRAYDAWDVDMLPDLLGDFAFVIWDPRAQKLVCARDASGQRSLFFRINAQTFAAASDLHQLFQDPSVPIVANEAHVRLNLVPSNVYRNEKDSSATYFQDIFSVEAGHVLTVGRESVQVRPYWSFDPGPEIRYRTDEEYAEHFRQLFFDVVRSQLRVAHPIALSLSGGLDSTSIAGSAQQLYRTRRAEQCGFTTLSSVYEGLECDETPWIQSLQEIYGFDARYIPFADGRWPFGASGFLEGPAMGPRTQAGPLLSRAVESGARVLLSGELADSFVGTQPIVFDALLRRGNLREAWRRLRLFHRFTGEAWRSILVFGCFLPLLPSEWQRGVNVATIQRDYHRNRHQWFPDWIAGQCTGALAGLQVQLSLEAERARRSSNPGQNLEYDLLYPPQIARHPAPWPIEIWRPYSDRRLHNFFMAVPPERKYVPPDDADDFYAGAKWIVRQGMQGIVPDMVRNRAGKPHFADQMRAELERDWESFEQIFGSSRQPEIARRGYVDGTRFWQRLEQYKQGVYGGDMGYLVRAIGLELWLRSLSQPRTEFVSMPSGWEGVPSSRLSRVKALNIA